MLFRCIFFVLVYFSHIDCRDFSSSASAKNSFFDTSYALVVGADRYESGDWPLLKSAREDALAMSAILENQGYEVTTLVGAEATRSRILGELRDNIALNLGPRDRILFYFSGHGETIERSGGKFGYIVPQDARIDDVSSWISMAEIEATSLYMDLAQHQLFIFDSCYGGQFAKKGFLSNLFREHPLYIERNSESRVREYITAGDEHDIAVYSEDDKYSYFTSYLIRALSGVADFNGDSYITTSELYTYLLSAASNPYQTPLYGVLPRHEPGGYWFKVAN
jgi:hypothetical protein